MENHPVHELIERRWSPYAYADKPVSRSDILCLLEAARWAPSSYNEQPWRFILGTKDDPHTYERLLECLVPANREWAAHAPVLMLSVASLNFAKGGKPNRHALHDVGLASAQMALQATNLGLTAHFMAGFDGDRARALFAIPHDYEPAAAVALGYAADGGDQSGPPVRVRNPIDAFAFAGDWGTAYGPA